MPHQVNVVSVARADADADQAEAFGRGVGG